MVAFLFLLLSLAPRAGSQELSTEERTRRLAAVSPKAVVVVFDISGSMEKYDMLSTGREATIKLIRGGLKPGDTFVLYTFDTSIRKVVEQVVPKDGIDAAAESVPGELSHKPGTNIRWAHHKALQWVEQKRPRKTFLILVSDSFNDPPAADDAARKEFGAYYMPKSLTTYPKSAENRDYERLLKLNDALGITAWGIGVKFDRQTGRPIERYLEAPVEETTPATVPSPPSTPAPAAKHSSPWWYLQPLIVLLLLLASRWYRAAQVVGVSLSESKNVYRNYRLRPGAAISLGGAGSGEYDLGYTISGTTHPVATLRRAGKGFRLEPSTEGAQGVAVMVNGELIKGVTPIAPGDEIKIRLPSADPAAPPRELRLEFGRTREES